MAGRKRSRGTGAKDRRDRAWSLFGDLDLHLFNEGRHERVYRKLGAHPVMHDGVAGTCFAVWAPAAASLSVVGDFNDWDAERSPLAPRGVSGIWEGFVPGAGKGARYKYHILSGDGGYRVDKADPYGLRHEVPPATASIVWDLDYDWGDAGWIAARGARSARDALGAPLSIYELHLGSWLERPRGQEALGYRDIADRLCDHATAMGFTHVELLPIMEHPFYGSWGYQVTGYFAATSRYGTPQDLMYLIDRLHQAGIGVILDWVPSHFPSDEHGLGYFDGTHLYEHADPRKGRHPDWGTLIFNYGRKEVVSFLLANACFWLEEYHADGLRVDAVASMLYLDYSRKAGEWIPNEQGGRENLEAVSFLRLCNETVHREHPDTVTIAEESTAWPGVSRAAEQGGLGFDLKWDMGWMHDTLRYVEREPIHRRHHQGDLTFRSLYAGNENFVLPLSHDEVVHGKRSLLEKMPGDEWQKFANLRLLYAWMFATPGKKLLFMGSELAQRSEWDHDIGLDWRLCDEAPHAGIQRLLADLNRVYRGLPALHAGDCRPDGFEWIDIENAAQSVLVLLRCGVSPDDRVVVALNFTPVPRHDYRVGVPSEGTWREVLNTDAKLYGGSGQGNLGEVEANPVPWHGRFLSINLTLPPLGAVFLAPAGEKASDLPPGRHS